jgi:predicted secreted protein
MKKLAIMAVLTALSSQAMAVDYVTFKSLTKS